MGDLEKPFYYCQNVESQGKGSGRLPDISVIGEKRRASNGGPNDAPGRIPQVGPIDVVKGVTAPLVGLSLIVEMEARPDGHRKFSCDLCNCKLGVESIVPHATGLKHRMEYLKKYSEGDYNLLSGLPRSEQTVAVVSMAQKIERMNGRGKIKYLPPQRRESRGDRDQQEYHDFVERVRSTAALVNIPPLFDDKRSRDIRPLFDDVPHQRERASFNEPLYSDDYREGPSRKVARRGDEYPEETFRGDDTFGVVSRSNYREKMSVRGNYRDEPMPAIEYEERPAVHRGDGPRRAEGRGDHRRGEGRRDEGHRDDFRRSEGRGGEDYHRIEGRGDGYRRTDDRFEMQERERARELQAESMHHAMSPPAQLSVERLLQADDGNFRLSGGNLGSLLSILSKCVVKNEEDAQMALQVSNALTQSLLKYRFQTMPGELLSNTLSKSAENFLGNQVGGMGGGYGGNAQMQQAAFMAGGPMREQGMSREQMMAPQQLQMQQQQLRQQLQLLQEQQHELDMKRKMKEDNMRQERQMPRQPPRADEDNYQHYTADRGGASYVYNQY